MVIPAITIPAKRATSAQSQSHRRKTPCPVASGWAAYSRLNSSHSDEPDKHDFSFLKNGASLRVSFGKFPTAPDSYTVQYSLFLEPTSAPVPPDAGFIEFDGSTEPRLIAITKMTLDEAREFYDHELAAEGWLKRGIGRSLKDEYNGLPYLREQSDIIVGLTKLPDGRTLVRIGQANGSLWEDSQPPDKDEVAAAAEAAAKGLEAADFPILNPTKSAKYDAVGKMIELEIDGSTLANVAEIYIKALDELGWKPEEGGIRDEQYTLITFAKGEQDISLSARKQDGKANVSFEGDGLVWAKELPGGKQIVPYERWLRLNKLPPTLDLLERYEKEMRAIGDR